MQVEGRNALLNALRQNAVREVFIQQSSHGGVLDEIRALARSQSVPVRELDKRELDKRAQLESHQGVIGILNAFPYAELTPFLTMANDKPLLLMLDHLQDPHNFGAIIRTAEAAGVAGIIIPKDRAVPVTETVLKVSTGAALMVPIIKVTNLSQTMDLLQKAGYWIGITDADAPQEIYEADLRDATVLIIGSEGKGVSRNLAKKADFALRIPMAGNISSLNASVAAAIVIYEAVRQRRSAQD